MRREYKRTFRVKPEYMNMSYPRIPVDKEKTTEKDGTANQNAHT